MHGIAPDRRVRWIGRTNRLPGWIVDDPGQPEDYAALAHMDVTMGAGTLAFACLSSLAAAALPAFRTASGRVAMQIKVAE